MSARGSDWLTRHLLPWAWILGFVTYLSVRERQTQPISTDEAKEKAWNVLITKHREWYGHTNGVGEWVISNVTYRPEEYYVVVRRLGSNGSGGVVRVSDTGQLTAPDE